MKEYLNGSVNNSLRRAKLLKTLIPHPVPAPELTSLAERCNYLLDEVIKNLEDIISDPYFGDDNFLRGHFRQYRRQVSSLSEVEYYGVPALRQQSEYSNQLNNIIFKIHEEIQYPCVPPICACFSTDYFFVYPKTNVIFIPLAEPYFLLHIPDIFHELCHILMVEKASNPKLECFSEMFDKAINHTVSYYIDEFTKRYRSSGPTHYVKLSKHLLNQWIEYWLEEFICDLFAVYTTGPAYAWSHMHLTASLSEDVFRFSPHITMTHPSDEARMRTIIAGLKILGLESTIAQVQNKWDILPTIKKEEPDADYNIAYPQELIEIIAVTVFNGVNENGFNIYSNNNGNNDHLIIKLLNQAWCKFWENPKSYYEWEKDHITNWFEPGTIQ